MKRFFIQIILLFFVFLVVSCSNTSSKDDGQMPDEEDSSILYQIQDVVRENLMWDTEEFFATTPDCKEAEITYGKATRLNAFKFKSVSYTKKNLENTWVFAIVGTPDAKKNPMPENGYPAVVLLHGGAGQVYTDWIRWWTDKGFVALAFDNYSNEFDSYGVNVVNPEGGPTSNDGPLIDNPADYADSWVYHSVANTILSNNILRARADVDKNRIGLTGISWGAVIAEITSGVDKRFTCFAPVYGSGYLTEDQNWISTAEKYGEEAFGGLAKEEWINFFDPSSYLPYSTKPMLFVSGIDDQCFSAVNRSKSAELPRGKVFYAQHYNLGHGHAWNKTPEIYYFFRHVMYGENYDLIEGITLDEDVAVLRTTEETFTGVNFLYTKSNDEDSHKWVWASVSVTKGSDGKYLYALPENVTAYLFETAHDNVSEYYRTSTQIYLINK